MVGLWRKELEPLHRLQWDGTLQSGRANYSSFIGCVGYLCESYADVWELVRVCRSGAETLLPVSPRMGGSLVRRPRGRTS